VWLVSLPTSFLSNISTHRPWFDINTLQVRERLMASVVPKRPWTDVVNGKHDLYGSVWIASTLVFAVAVVNNFVKYVTFQPSHPDAKWIFDFSKVVHSRICILVIIFIILDKL
jgi:hypothetical protein